MIIWLIVGGTMDSVRFYWFILFIFAVNTPTHTYATTWAHVIQKHCPRAVLCTIQHNQTQYWVKRPDPKKFTCRHIIWGKFLRAIIPIALLRPQVINTPEELIKNEIARNRLFQSKGISVPQIIHHTKDVIVMNDLGDNAETLLKQTPDINQRIQILNHVVHALAHLHQKGLHHGRPLLKDLVYQTKDKGGVVHFLDLAESHCPHLTASQAHARDIMSFAYAALPFVNNSITHFHALMSEYSTPESPQVFAHIKQTMNFLTPFKVIISPLARVLGKDTQRAINAHTSLVHLVQHVASNSPPR